MDVNKLVKNIFGLNADEKFFKMYFKSFKVGKLRRAVLLLKLKRLQEKKNSYIGRSVDTFQEKPFFPHGLHCIHIAAGCRIGKNVTIFQNVTIGQSKEKYPMIGDNVIIGAGANIIGDVKIGNNVRIGAGAVVTFDVPDNSTVVGQKARILKRDPDYWVEEY